jgi:flagellar basal body rod protein FlgG
MANKSDFLDGLRLLVDRAELAESEKERLLSLLTEARFSTVELEDLSKIAGIVESEKASLEQEVSESSDPDLINEMSDISEALDAIEYDSAIKTFNDLGIKGDSSNELSAKSGQWLLDKFAGLAS